MATIEFVHVSKKFENGFVAVDDFSLSLLDGELMVLVGPSGCGKSTALRILAGLEDPTDGEVRIDGRNVGTMAPQGRDVAMVFQSYALYPHMTVQENIEFGLKLHHVSDEEIAQRVAFASELLGLGELLQRRPKALSGGQRQRVAMGRAIVREPKVFLMDEPLSNLDAKLRVHMRSEILRLQRRLKTTMLYVTHDQVEAMTMGNRVAVMRDGALLQVGTPKEIYNNPSNAFIAGFIGSPSMNLAEATLDRTAEGAVWLQLGDQRLLLDESVLTGHPKLSAAVGNGTKIVFGVRPEDLEDSALASAPPEHCLESTVDLVEELGSQTMVHFGVNAVAVNAEERPDLAVSRLSGVTFVGTFNPRTEVRAGERARIAVDTARLHFFDLATGVTI